LQKVGTIIDQMTREPVSGELHFSDASLPTVGVSRRSMTVGTRTASFAPYPPMGPSDSPMSARSGTSISTSTVASALPTGGRNAK
jgi:hypothetical protein